MQNNKGMLWNKDTEHNFFKSALDNFATPEQLFYTLENDRYFAYWPKGYSGTKTTLQSRNISQDNRGVIAMAYENNKKNGTKTSAFGTSGRINHDSSSFYDSKLYADHKIPKKIHYKETTIPTENINRIYCESSKHMTDIPDDSVHLMITSPPYNVKKEYDRDLSIEEYRQLLKNVFQETYKKLTTGGRACINVANLGRKPYIPLHSFIITDMIEIGFLMRGEIIWNKASSASPSTAWGSWLSAANPVLRDIHEYILVFSKGSFPRKKGHKDNTIKKEEFLEWTKSVWTFPAVSARSIGHPAHFPEELSRRLIALYSFKDDVILYPFCGSGTTCLAALKNHRSYVGYDIDKSYVELPEKRIYKFASQPELFS